MTMSWNDTAKDWPETIFLKSIDRLPGFPYSRGYMRNLTTGKAADPFLRRHLFRCGRFPGITRDALTSWLESRTK